MFKNKKMKFLFSLFAIPLLTSYSIFFIDTNKSSLAQVTSNYKSNIADTSINFEDSFPVVEQSIKSLSDYIVSYEDNNIQPVNVNNAVVGMTADLTTLTYTTYSGLLLWSSNLTKNPLIKNFYATYYKVNNIGAYRVNHFAYQKNTGLLFVLFGDKTKTKQIVFALDIYTGKINIPSEAYLKNNQILTKVSDGSSFIFFNSSDEIIVTSGGTKVNVDKTTKIFRYAPKTMGFADLKLNISIPTAFSINASNPEGYTDNDLLLSIVPGYNGINYGYYLYTVPNATKFNWSIWENKTEKFTTQDHSSFSYYIFPLNDDLTKNRNNYKIVNNQTAALKWGYVSKNAEFPKFDDIYKRVFKLENAASPNTTYLFALADSYWKYFDSYILYSDNGKATKSNGSRGFGPVMSSSNNNNLLVSQKDFQQENQKVAANSYDFQSFGYDDESNLIYFSFGGERIDTTTNKSVGYLSKMGYFQFLNSSLSIKTDSYQDENTTYSLYSVGFDSYSSTDKYYMGKQLDKSDPIWLSRKGNENYTQTTNDNISFSDLSVSNTNLIQQIETNKLFYENMPDSITNADLKNLVTSPSENDTIQISKISSSNQSGVISLRVNINHRNNFGDGLQNGSTDYVFQLDVYGYSLQKDFIFKFITTDMVNIGFNDKINKINEIKASTGPSGITKSQILTYFLDENILDKDGKVLQIQYDWVTLNPNDDLGILTVEINLPANNFPLGFPKESLSINAVYKDFWVHVDPLPPDPIPLPPSSETPSKSDVSLLTNAEAEQIGIISSGVIGVTLLFAILFLFLFLKHRKQVKKLDGELTIK